MYRRFGILAVICLIDLVSAFANDAAMVPRESWPLQARLQMSPPPALSIDGLYAAYVMLDNGQCGAGSTQPRVVQVVQTRGQSGSKRLSGELQESWNFSWSPTANVLAFYQRKCNSGAAPTLGVYDASSGHLREITVPSLVTTTGPPTWSPSGREIIVVANTASAKTSERPNTDAPLTEWRTLATDPPLSNQQSSDSFVGLDLQSVNQSPATKTATLLRISVDSGIQTTVSDRLPVLNNMLDYRISPSGRWATYLTNFRANRENPARFRWIGDVVLVDIESGKSETLLRGTETDARTFMPGNFQWHPTRDMIIAVHQQALWSWDPVKGLRNVPTPDLKTPLHPQLLAFFPSGAHIIVGLDEVDGRCAGTPCFAPTVLARVASETGRAEIIDIKGLGEFNAVFKNPRGVLACDKPNNALVQLEDVVTGTSRWYELAFGSATPPKKRWENLAELTLTDQRAQDGRVLAVSESVNDAQRLSIVDSNLEPSTDLFTAKSVSAAEGYDVRVFSTKARDYDGKFIQVRTAVIARKGKFSNNTPAIVVGYQGQRLSSFARGLDVSPTSFTFVPKPWLLKLGYNLILVDLPMRPRETGPGSVLTELRDLMVPQVNGAADRGLVDRKQLGIIGVSRGGYLAVGFATVTPLFRAAIAINGVGYDLPSMFTTENHDLLQKDFRLPTSLWADWELIEVNSPFRHLNKLTAPSFIVIGGRDRPQRVLQSGMLYNALKLLGKPAYLLKHEEGGHEPGSWSKAAREDLLSRLKVFLERYLPTNSDQRSLGTQFKSIQIQ